MSVQVTGRVPGLIEKVFYVGASGRKGKWVHYAETPTAMVAMKARGMAPFWSAISLVGKRTVGRA